MKKLVFEGNINGKTFDSAQDYNKEMSRLLSEGATNIQAFSKTHMVDEVEDVKKEEVEDVKKEFDYQDYIPFFNSEVDRYYLDFLTSTDDNLNEKHLSIAKKKLDSALVDLKKLIAAKDLTIGNALELINLIKEVRGNIKDDAEHNHTTTQEITERITSDTNKLKLLNAAKPVIATVSDYYDEAFTLVRDYLLQL